MGRGKRDEAKAALVDFLRNDKWGVASETWRARRGERDVHVQILPEGQVGRDERGHYFWYSPKTQIDLLIYRKDQVINLCEMKFSTKPFAIDKKYAANLQNKMGSFREETDTKKAIFL